MTKREIIKQNKEAIECILQRYELNGNELLKLFGKFSIIGTDFLCELSEIIPEEGFQFDYNKDDLLSFYHDPDFIDGILDFSSDVSYVIGTLLSFDALKETSISDIKMKYINDNVNRMQIKEVLQVLDTDFDRYQKWIEACKDNLKRAMGELYEESYSYNRSNRSR